MAKILSKKRVIEYSLEYKLEVIELTERLDVNAVQIAEVLDLHPMMVYRWRQEYREGKFVAQPTRRISMTKEPPDGLESERTSPNLNGYAARWRS